MAHAITAPKQGKGKPHKPDLSSSIDKLVAEIKGAREAYHRNIRPIQDARAKFDKIKNDIKGLSDEYSRPGTVTRLSVEQAFKQLETIVGPLGKHPYARYHGEHLKIFYGAINALGAGTRATKAMDEAISTSVRVKRDSGSTLDAYSPASDRFKTFTDSMGGVYVAVWVFRAMVEGDVARLKLSEATVKGYFDVARASAAVHAKARAALDELNALYAALYQSLYTVRGLIGEADRNLGRIAKDPALKGMGKNIATIGRNIQEINAMVATDNSAGIDGLETPILDAIATCQTMCEAWIMADYTFTEKMAGFDVLAVIRGTH